VPDVADDCTLEAHGIHVRFGGVMAVNGVDIALRSGEILGLIGPNGAGKTTLVNVLSGFQAPTEGDIWLNHEDVTTWTPRRRAANGLARTFQDIRLFTDLTVFENVEAGALGVGLGRKEARRMASELLDRLALGDKHDHPAASLPFGDERRLGIARALGTKPRFLLLDEPAAGLNETESDELVKTLMAIRGEFSLALLIIEHDMRVIMSLCERIQVLDYGTTIAVGSPAEVRSNPLVLTAYLGDESALDVA
jgi:branched-chain amino acid transport system ATP-binding protein